MKRLRHLLADQDWMRIVMNGETRRLVERLNPSQCDVLEISGNAWGQWMTFKSYESIDYPEYDICATALPRQFDLVIAEQVFEHLLWPYRAGRNAYAMVRPGGHLLVTTPFLVRIHNTPVDCSRWTETGLKHFLAECGFDLTLIQTGSWGNRTVIRANLSLKWARYRPILHVPGALRNEPDFPVVVWALAAKRQIA